MCSARAGCGRAEVVVAEEQNPQFVIVLGPARSGTSLLRDLIAASPAVASVPFDVSHVWRSGRRAQEDDYISRDALTPELAQRIRRRLLRIARRTAGRLEWQNIRYVAEKTVGNALRPEFVAGVLPDARYVRIVRDPRPTIASTVAAWRATPNFAHLARKSRMFSAADIGYAGWYAANAVRGRLAHKRGLVVWGARYSGILEDVLDESLETVCARQWLASVESVDRFFANLRPDRGISVTYETLTADPADLARIWTFLGVPDDGFAAEVHAARIIADADTAAGLPARLDDETRGRVEARMAQYGYG
jgi:Sulfotransferase family